MDEPLIITRDIDIDLTADELWSLVAHGEGWERWLVDDADVVVETGASGVVRDDGRDRVVRIHEVVDGERVSFEWWPAERPGEASAVELVVQPATTGAVLHVTEVFPPQRTVLAMAASFRWEVRALAAWVSAGDRVHA
jgi:Polyketide cyclase / dehydrase and lipid transport